MIRLLVLKEDWIRYRAYIRGNYYIADDLHHIYNHNSSICSSYRVYKQYHEPSFNCELYGTFTFFLVYPKEREWLGY